LCLLPGRWFQCSRSFNPTPAAGVFCFRPCERIAHPFQT
jgi:hypothetical protein